MKNVIKNILAFAFMAISFATVAQNKKEIKKEMSTVVWKGHKVTGSHEGTIAIKSGALRFDANNKLAGGMVMIDMTSIACTDLEGEYKGKLEGHLKADDFFGVAKFPTSTLVFNEVKSTGKNTYKVKADITIKGKKETIGFNISVFENKANASLKINRTKFGIKYGSASFFDNLQDKAISDDFDLVVNLKF